MPEQFENPEASKLEDETVSDATAQQRIDRVAERLAKKSGHTEQEYDKALRLISQPTSHRHILSRVRQSTICAQAEG
jgi:hypothetical protein